MKKSILVILVAAFLVACGESPQQVSLKEALTAKLQDDSDLKDYKLNPSDVADCVVQSITEGLPGFAGDPRRPKFFEAYAKFVAVKSPADAEKAMEEYKDLFGSLEQAREAAVSVTDHIMGCMGVALEQHAPE
ncbi:MAG: hypothetical protein H6R26_1723 [Proteobacteria bacterium]|nr:hypothetical protein [Pseudomonadota bacterium]